MKQSKCTTKRVAVGAVLVVMLGAQLLLAADQSPLTRAQWLTRIGACVTQESVLRETLPLVAEGDRVEFTQRLLRAVSRLPVSPDEKAAAFIRASVACIGAATGENKALVIAEVFACVPVEYLPVITEELARRFDQEYNGLSDEQYEKIASDAVRAAVTRNARTDEPSVRNTFVILAFLRHARRQEDLQPKLLALLPDDRMRGLAAGWLTPALRDRNYDGLLAAADAGELPLSTEAILQLLGQAELDRLLARMDSGEPLADVIGVNLDMLPSTGFIQPVDYNINRLPRPPRPVGYQNQRTSIRYGDKCVPCDYFDGKAWFRFNYRPGPRPGAPGNVWQAGG